MTYTDWKVLIPHHLQLRSLYGHSLAIHPGITHLKSSICVRSNKPLAVSHESIYRQPLMVSTSPPDIIKRWYKQHCRTGSELPGYNSWATISHHDNRRDAACGPRWGVTTCPAARKLPVCRSDAVYGLTPEYIIPAFFIPPASQFYLLHPGPGAIRSNETPQLTGARKNVTTRYLDVIDIFI